MFPGPTCVRKWSYWEEFGVDEEQIRVGGLHGDAGDQFNALIGGLDRAERAGEQRNGGKNQTAVEVLRVFTVMKVPVQILVITFTNWLLLTSMSLRTHLMYLHFALSQSWEDKPENVWLKQHRGASLSPPRRKTR